MDGLIIRKYWLDKYLAGLKDLEIRGTKTNKVGQKIFLLSNGKIYASAIIIDCYELDRNMYDKTYFRHRVNYSFEHVKTFYPRVYGWALADIKKIEPKLYKHPKGAVIWVKNVEPLIF